MADQRANEPPAAYMVTCEHGGNEVPASFADRFEGANARRCLHSHRGHDPGALLVAGMLAEHWGVPLIASTVTRLLVDLNRSESSPTLMSEFSREVSATEREKILRTYYRPYRKRVFDRIEDAIRQHQRVVHLSIHSFAARFRGRTRTLDLGVLFDPERELERSFCDAWISALRDRDPRRRVLANEPYAGTDDGLTTTCRERYRPAEYLGIEIEITQRYVRRTKTGLTQVANDLVETIVQVVRTGKLRVAEPRI